jgi:hypothetical protein
LPRIPNCAPLSQKTLDQLQYSLLHEAYDRSILLMLGRVFDLVNYLRIDAIQHSHEDFSG